MEKEHRYQKDIKKFDVKPEGSTKFDSDIKCHKCRKTGHRAKDCKSKSKSSHLGCNTPKPFTDCAMQHTIKQDMPTIYFTLLSSCPVFKNMSVANQASVLEREESWSQPSLQVTHCSPCN